MNNTVIPIITIDGGHLMRDGHRFLVKGIVYQLTARRGGSVDPLTDDRIDDVHRDIEIFKDLGLNALFIYRVDPESTHDKCMNALAKAGIYVITLVMDHRNREVINRMQPRQSYSETVQNHFRSAATCLSRYSNTLGVCISSDLISEASEQYGLVAETCEVLAQATRELKRYMRSQHTDNGQRILPVGIADTFWSLTHTNSFEYLTGPETRTADPDAAGLDFYCVNHYAPPDPIQAEQGHSRSIPWNMIHTLPQFNHITNRIPILLSEYSSSNAERPRSFQETTDLYSQIAPPGADSPMLNVLSGGFVYEMFEHANQYGLVKLQDDKKTVEKLPDYTSFKNKLRDCGS